MEQVPYFCQFWNEQTAKFLAQKSSLYLVPILSLPSSFYEEGKGKEGKKARGEREEDDEEEEEEEEEAEEEEEEEIEEEELSKEDMEDETDKGAKMTWSEIKGTTQRSGSQQSLQWHWQQDLKLMMKEEQENDEKEVIGR